MAKSSKKSDDRIKRKKRAARKRNRAIFFALEMVILVVMLVVLYVVLKAQKMGKISINEENIVTNDTVETNTAMKGYRNIALFGVDSRDKDLGKGTRTDTIMVASINQDTGDVKLISVYRDTYLNLGNDTYNKCNAAYAKGGPEQAINMLNMNLDLDIKDYVTVGFTGVIETVDALGGVTINVDDSEIQHLYNYQICMAKELGLDYTPVKHSGEQTLDGLQATAYCRIRYTKGDDFKRAERQRTVLQAIADKARKADVTTLNKVVDGVLPNVSTSLDSSEIIKVLGELSKYKISATEGFPFEDMRATGSVKKQSMVIPIDLKDNVVKLHEFLFDDKDYKASSEVTEYSGRISSDTNAYVK